MNDRPLAKYESGSLYLDDGGQYRPATRFAVVMKRAVQQELSGKHAQRKAAECTAALEKYDKANSGQMENI